MKRRSTHIPFPTVRLDAKGKIIPTKPKVKPSSCPFVPFVESRALNWAVKVPLAPIQMLTAEQKIQMQPPLLIQRMTFDDMEAYYTSVRAAEFVLE
jgi:hypothetical protein